MCVCVCVCVVCVCVFVSVCVRACGHACVWICRDRRVTTAFHRIRGPREYGEYFFVVSMQLHVVKRPSPKTGDFAVVSRSEL